MNIIYAYSNCTDKKYHELFPATDRLVLRADQKYHGLLIRGLSENGVYVKCLSGLPVNRQTYRKILCREADETEGNARFHYYTTLNVPGIRQCMVFFGGFFNTFFAKKNDTVLLCDYQNLANAYGTLLAAWVRRIPSAVIVMDMPEFLTSHRFVEKIYRFTFRLADRFVLLTEQMNEKVNPRKKPAVIIEGISDSDLPSVSLDERFEVTIGKKIVIYAGNIAKLYGIQNLVEGFLLADIPESELWIYGDGDYRAELEDICRAHENVKYYGVCPNEEVVYAEQRAALLVNPRPTAPDYTKYSFPSKNMEYMASGTPVLTTDLPGMPEEYHGFVYRIDNDHESVSGIGDVLRSVLSEDPGARYQKGWEAGRYGRQKKSGRVQAEKILDLFGGRER